MITCSRRFQFCAGHRVVRHESKCAHPHGHNYVLIVHAEAPELDSVGRVIDFSVLKAAVGTWIDLEWDHGFLVNQREDPEMMKFLIDNGYKYYPCPFNPTAENLAEHLLVTICPALLGSFGVTATKITLWETENCFVEVTL